MPEQTHILKEPELEIIQSTGDDALARVYVARLRDGALIECVESVQPPVPREQKWVLIVSTLKGCPVGCPICDAGGSYRGKLTAEEIHAQIDHLIRNRYPDRRVAIPKLKIQFARMGDPAFNPAVLSVLRDLPALYPLAGLMPSISTVAPAGCDDFFEQLIEIKRELYPHGRFQMQFSVHTSDETARRTLIPVRTWSLSQMAAYGERFREPGDRKVTLNFAPARGWALDANAIGKVFDPDHFLIKLTPINPTQSAIKARLRGMIDPADPAVTRSIAATFQDLGFETLISIGELRENDIGSNCGMYVSKLGPGTGDTHD